MTFFAGVNKALDNSKANTESVNIGGYSAFASVGDSTNYSNVVPVTVLEDGGTGTDDILNNPITITINGTVGDFVLESSYPTIAARDVSGVGAISSLLPASSSQQLQSITKINQAGNDALLLKNRASDLQGKAAQLFDNSGSVSKGQQNKFQEYMESIHYSRLPVSISTQRRSYDSMALSSLVINSNNETNDITFSATFSSVDYIGLERSAVITTFSSPSSLVAGKTSDAKNLGGQTPESNKTGSILSSIIG